MADKDFKVKTGIDLPNPLPASEGGTGQTSLTNAFNALLPAQAGNANKVLQTDGTNTQWYSIPAPYTRGGTASRPGSPTAGDLHFNTDFNYFEQYTSLGWFPIAAVPGTPTGVTATNQGSGRAFNNGQASVAFTPNTGGGAPTSFTVTSSPGSYTATGSSSPIVITGLQSSTQYTYTATATSPYGTSAASAASAGVTATTVPQAPTIGTATGGNAQASVTFTANATGGSAITSYTVTSSPGNITASGASSPITVTGLTNNTSYTFTVTATNANGTSAASAASNSTTPSDIQRAGYVLGGLTAAGSLQSSIQKFTMPQEVRTTLSASLSAAGIRPVGTFANSPTAGYHLGGSVSNAFINTIQKLTFSDEVRTNISATLANISSSGSGHSNNGVAGYTMGGMNDGPGDTTINTIQKLAYSNEARTTVSATLEHTLHYSSSAANSGLAGYTFGGASNDNTIQRNYIQKLAYSNEARTTLGATLTTNNRYSQAFANSGTAAYVAGGYGTSSSDTFERIDKLTFSNETKSTLSAVLGAKTYAGSSFSNNDVAGYVAGGYRIPPDNYSAAITKLTYSTETVSTPSATLAVGIITYASGFANTGNL